MRVALHAESQLLTPYGTWEATPGWAAHAAVPGPATVEVPLEIVVPRTATPGRYWALARVMAVGEIVYTEAISDQHRAARLGPGPYMTLLEREAD